MKAQLVGYEPDLDANEHIDPTKDNPSNGEHTPTGWVSARDVRHQDVLCEVVDHQPLHQGYHGDHLRERLDKPPIQAFRGDAEVPPTSRWWLDVHIRHADLFGGRRGMVQCVRSGMLGAEVLEERLLPDLVFENQKSLARRKQLSLTSLLEPRLHLLLILIDDLAQIRPGRRHLLVVQLQANFKLFDHSRNHTLHLPRNLHVVVANADPVDLCVGIRRLLSTCTAHLFLKPCLEFALVGDFFR
mmetsp:Transcript_12893/g.32484  ORF Transcript_12893/g.32484 Transcript_12893/m.32484 type:complete len:243 (+) Transcript_12893:370-1098(+)